MRRYEIEDSLSLASETAVAYRQNTALKDLMQFDGINNAKIPGATLDDVITLTSLTVIELSEIIEISKPNYYRKRQEDQLDLKTIDKLASLIQLYDQGQSAFGSIKDFNRWLSQENLHLGNLTPKLYLKTEQGRKKLHQAIGRVEHGLYG
ncbi:MAG: antitoxin Xre/MbcA/ParS toxin-binding domain-containing protein [Bacteroidota bacterium]